jgi:tetratricopeptide (TPR) repeat protein
LEEALTKFETAYSVITPTTDSDLYAMLTDAAMQQYDLASLLKYAPQAEELSIRHGNVLYQAIAHRAWGTAYRLTGEYEQAEIRLNHALQLFQSLGTRWQLGRTIYELGHLAMARKNIPTARRHFNDALMEFEKMKAAPNAERVRVILTQLKDETSISHLPS